MDQNHDLDLDLAFTGANPTELDEDTACGLKPRNVEQQKRVFCENYNRCLDTAIKKDWAGFSCNDCPCYIPISWYQRAADQLGLIAAYQASGYVHTHGNANRKVGVKPAGYGNKGKKRLPVIQNRLEGGDVDMQVLRRAVVG